MLRYTYIYYLVVTETVFNVRNAVRLKKGLSIEYVIEHGTTKSCSPIMQ